jgi:hypothetical protein
MPVGIFMFVSVATRQKMRKSFLLGGVVLMLLTWMGCVAFGAVTGNAPQAYGVHSTPEFTRQLADGNAYELSEGLSFYLRIYDRKTGELYVSRPVKIGSKLFFGWIHSLEKIPWNEYYHVDKDLRLILDAITFPAFGAGIPENKGRICYVKDGLIHMEEIDQPFEELLWLNSHMATQEILIDGKYVARGSSLPQHTQLRLVIEKGDANEI